MNNRIDRDTVEAVVMLLSMSLGLLFSVIHTVQGQHILAFITFLAGLGLAFLSTTGGRSSLKRYLGITSRRSQNEASPTTKRCSNCGWHNHQANRNCVECSVSL